MKKITLLLLLTLSSYAFTQNLTTGIIDLTTDRSVRFDINTSSSLVTMTLIFPVNTYLAIGMSQGTESDIALGQFMGDMDDDCIVGLTTGLQDRNMTGSTSAPQLDNSSDMDDEWTVVSNTDDGTLRTLVATRAVDTGDTEDTIFPSSLSSSFPLIFAYGGSAFGYHGLGNYGAAMGTLAVLSDGDFQLNRAEFTISPNPSSTFLNIRVQNNSSSNFEIQIFDVLGKLTYSGYLSEDTTALDVSNWSKGVYLVKVSSDDASQTKRFIKQ